MATDHRILRSFLPSCLSRHSALYPPSNVIQQLTWQQTSWVFPKGEGNFKPARFLNFGQDYAGVPSELAGYVYIYGFKQTGSGAAGCIDLSRVLQEEIKDRRGVIPTTGAVYHPVLKRCLLASDYSGSPNSSYSHRNLGLQ